MKEHFTFMKNISSSSITMDKLIVGVICIIVILAVILHYLTIQEEIREDFNTLSCYDQLYRTFPSDIFIGFLRSEPYKKIQVLRMMKAHGANGCIMPYDLAKDFELTSCPRQRGRPNLVNGCVYNYTTNRDKSGVISDKNFYRVFERVIDEVGKPWYDSVSGRIRALPRSDKGPKKGEVVKKTLDKLFGKKNQGFDIPRDWVKEMNITANKVISEQRSLDYVPVMPNIGRYPKLASVIKAYQRYYARKKAEFDNATLRIGYTKGRVYTMMNPDGAIDTMPLIQQKFDGGYYTLLYKYTANSYTNSLTDETKSLADFFFKKMDKKTYYPMAPTIPGDPKQSFSDVQELILSPDAGYRNQFLVDVMRYTRVRFSIILQVFNSKQKADGAMKPKFSLELYKYGKDKPNEEGVGMFFSKYRVRDSKYTSNKNLLRNQHGIRIFAINCGKDAPNAWTIAMPSRGRARGRELNCNAPIYMTIPTPSIKSKVDQNYLNTLKTSCTWAWMQKYEGRILYSNGDPLDMSKNMGNVEDFENKHVGDIMLLWMKCEYHDPYQLLQVVPWNVFVDPHGLQTIMFRPKDADDNLWAESILKIMTGGEDVKSMEEFKVLVEKLSGKQELDFQEYVDMCDTYTLNLQTRKFATDVGCIF
jgi:hypothetical protein